MDKKKWYQSKIIWVAVGQATVGIIIAIETQYPGIGGLVIAKSVVDVLLRLVSSSTITS